MPGKNNVSTYRPRIFDSTLPHKSPTSSGYSSTSKLYFKSDGSNENTIIDFKETWSHLSPEQQRPESAGRRMNVEDNKSTDWLRLFANNSLLESRISSRYSFTSGLSFKSDESKENTLIDFKERWSHLSPELQRPESAGRRMNVEDNVSTDRLSIRDRIRLLKSRTSSGYSSTSSLSFKSHESKDNTIIDFKGRSSTLIPELQRPESAGRTMNEWRTRSTDNLRSNDKWDILHLRLKRTKSMSQSPDFKESSNLSPEQQRPESAGRRMDEWRKRSTDRLRSTDICDIPLKRLKRTKSMSEIHDFKESSNLSPEQQRPESAGRRMNVEDNVSTDRLSIRDRIRLFKCRSLPIYSDFKKSSSLREKDTSLSTTPEIVVAGGMETT